MGQCGFITSKWTEETGEENGYCGEPTVLWDHCEKHLTERERAVLELVRAAEDHAKDGIHCMIYDTERLSRAAKAVKEVK